MIPFPAPRRSLPLLSLLALWLAACAATETPPPAGVESSSLEMSAAVTPDEARSALNRYASQVASSLRETTSSLTTAFQTPEEREAALLWAHQIASQVRETTSREDPLSALLDTWSLMARASEFLQKGEGKTLFGNRQKRAVEVTKQLERHIESLAKTFLGPKNYPGVEAKILEYDQAHPMTQSFPSTGTGAYFTLEKTGKETLKFITGIPLAPVRTLTGIGEGAGSFKDFTVTAGRFTDVMQDFPRETRLQMELFLSELKKDDMVTSSLKDLGRLSRSSERLADTAQTLPERVGAESRKVLDGVAKQQPALSTLLKDLQATLTETRKTLAEADGSIRNATEAARAWQATADSVASATREIAPLVHPELNGSPPGEQQAKPFDINEYTRAALALTTGTKELRGLVADLRSFAGSNEIQAPLDQVRRQTESTLDHSADRARGLIDHAFYRTAELLALVFVLALLYRALTRRMEKSKG